MKKELSFFGCILLLVFHITGCKKHSSGPPPVPSIYMADDAATGIFNYVGIVYDTAWAIDSTYPPLQVSPEYPSGFHTILKPTTHQVSGQIRIKKLVSDSTVIHLTRPLNDPYDSVSIFSGLTFQSDKGYFENIQNYNLFNEIDTILKGTYLNHNLSIPNYKSEFINVYTGFIELTNGDGKFVNSHWEINYQTKGIYNYYLYANPMPSRYFLYGYHTYHLTCYKLP